MEGDCKLVNNSLNFFFFLFAGGGGGPRPTEESLISCCSPLTYKLMKIQKI